MKVEELIKYLKTINPKLDVVVWAEMSGDNFEIKDISEDSFNEEEVVIRI